MPRPIGIWLLLWPALWALWIAGQGRPDARLLLIFVTGVVVMRSAGCVINDYADRDFDPSVARTRDRPLAAKRVAPGEALYLFVALGLVAVWLAMQLDPLARLYAVGGGVLTVTYPWLKRFVHLPQFYLGVAFGWSIPMAFAAITGEVPRIAWLLVTAVVLWAAVYDTMYAMVDRKDDEKIGIKSTAILFGEADRLIIAVMQGMTLFALWLAGVRGGARDLVPRRSCRGGGLLRVRALADPQARAGSLFSCIQQQSFRRARDLRRPGARLSLPGVSLALSAARRADPRHHRAHHPEQEPEAIAGGSVG